MAELPLLLIDIAATLIECLLRLMFWIGRKCGWIKPCPRPSPRACKRVCWAVRCCC